ncbi:solute carrier family 10 [Colletotrichum truncatum]|uniref:Solute carrier family 10 n=1 Tax=Colletotrichum truncatum TaxID=5467 RepID=A0ACC3YID1_COLTU
MAGSASGHHESEEASQPQSTGGRIWAKAVKIFKFVLAQWLAIGFGLSCVFAYLFPNVAARGGPIRSEYSIIYGGIAIIFLVSGLQLSHAKLRQNLTNWRLHIIVQGTSFIIIPVILLIIIHIIIAAGGLRNGILSTPIIVGMVVASCLPTTIASNVVMTRASGGDDAAAIIEVVIGNVLGSFISPGLIYGFIPKTEEFAEWQPANPSTLGSMYGSVLKQLGLSVLLPLAVGQVLRWFFEKQVDWALRTFYLAKVSTFCLILLVWTTFSAAFKTGALYQTPHASIIFNVFMNVGLYMLFTVICFFAARPPLPFCDTVNAHVADSKALRRSPSLLRRIVTARQLSREQTIAVCFCGAAKTTSLGIPLATAMWTQSDDLTRALIQIPVLLYTIEQVFMAQILVYFFKWYLRRGDKADTSTMEDEEAGVAGDERNTGGEGETRDRDGEGDGEKAGDRGGRDTVSPVKAMP